MTTICMQWLLRFMVWLLLIVGLGVVTGALVFPLLGPLFGSKLHPLEHVVAGAKHLGFIALVWAPGIALVACVMHARSRRNRQN